MTKPLGAMPSRQVEIPPGGNRALSETGVAARAEYIASLAAELAELADGPKLKGLRACLLLALDEARRVAGVTRGTDHR